MRVVDGGISPGAWGYEAGQSGVGDIFGWFVAQAAPAGVASHERLTELAAAQPVGAHGLIALDWWNGNRSLLVNHDLSGMIVGLTLATRPEDVYRALLESTAFGTRMIIEAFVAAGVAVDDLVVAGGLTSNDLLMQIYATAPQPVDIIASARGGTRLGDPSRCGRRGYPSIEEGRRTWAACTSREPADRSGCGLDGSMRIPADDDHFGRGGNDVMLGCGRSATRPGPTAADRARVEMADERRGDRRVNELRRQWPPAPPMTGISCR